MTHDHAHNHDARRHDDRCGATSLNDGRKSASPAVEVHGLTVAFGQYHALRDLAFEVPAGGFLTIIGPNGGGKSTLLKALLGLVPAPPGTVRLLGRPYRDLPRGAVGYVPQIKTLDRRFPARSLDLVATGVLGRWPGLMSRATRQQAYAALQSIGAQSLADRPLSELSGGELQRVYLARCLSATPQVLLLDEPATGIDQVGEADMYRLLEGYQRDSGAALLMVTHDWHAVCHHCSEVLILNGAQIAFGPPGETLTEDNLQRAFGHRGHQHTLFLTR